MGNFTKEGQKVEFTRSGTHEEITGEVTGVKKGKHIKVSHAVNSENKCHGAWCIACINGKWMCTHKMEIPDVRFIILTIIGWLLYFALRRYLRKSRRPRNI